MTTIRATAPLALLAALAVTACSQEPPAAPETPAPGASDAPTPTPAPTPEPAPSPNTPSPDAPYVGIWAGPQADCANAPATGERAPIQITRTQFLGYENRCDIRSVTRTSEGFDAVLSCESEGVSSTERLGLTVNADTLDIAYRDRDGATASFRRCPY